MRSLQSSLRALPLSRAGGHLWDGVPRQDFKLVRVNQISKSLTARHVSSREPFDELVADIRRHGVIEPLLLRPMSLEGFEVVCGHRRLDAAIAAGLDVVPAFVRDIRDAEAQEISLANNIHRENLSNLDEATALAKLKAELGSLSKVAVAVSKSKAWVSSRLNLLDMEPAAVRLRNAHITSDVDILNMVSRAVRLDPDRAEEVVRDITNSDRKRVTARLALDIARQRASASVKNSPEMQREVGKLARAIVRIGKSEQTPASRAREVREALAHSSKPARAELEQKLKKAFSLGRAGAGTSPIHAVAADVVHALHRQPEEIQHLIIRAYSAGIRHPVFQLEEVVGS